LLKQVLSEFLSNPGVTTAALVGRDGFVIDMAAKTSLDRDAIGALGSSAILFFDKGGAQMKSGKLRQMILEYQNGAIILTPITEEEFLMILTDTTNALGNLAYLIANTIPRIAAVM
jgi:predicted regulator of Ras-like GTPase activity (Roadblock/LC7/MglB family)